LAALVRADYEGTYLTDQEIQLACMQLINAGFETTSTGTCNGVFLLATHPEERQKLEKYPELLENAVEEILRFASPLEGLFRTATRDVEIAGYHIPKRGKIRVVYSSANRDDEKFEDPNSFRVDRDVSELRSHIAFGQGPHACIGAALARTELRIGLGTLFRRLPELALNPKMEPKRSTMLVINGFSSLPVQWNA
jgi:cytochrome P450